MGYKGNDSCLAKVPEDEPIFVLRAQDRLAPATVRLWADLVDLFAGGPTEKTTEARKWAAEMEFWQRQHGTKVPD